MNSTTASAAVQVEDGRIEPGRGLHQRVPIRQGEGVLRLFQGLSHRQDAAHAGRLGARQHLRKVSGEVRRRHVRMGIEELQGHLLLEG